MSIQIQPIIPEISDIVNFYTPELVEEIANETGFVKRQSMLGGKEFLGVMTQGLFGKPECSLSQMAAMSHDINPELKISKQGFHERLNESGVAFLKRMLSKALELSTSKLIDADVPMLLNNFNKVHLIDSTYIPLPSGLSDEWRGTGGDGSKAGLKLQLAIEYKSGKYERIVTTEGVTPDQSYMEQAITLVGLNDLIIYDLGYFKQKYMIDISEQKGYFISRLNHQSSLYKKQVTTGEDSFERFDLEKELKELDKEQIVSHEYAVCFLNSGKALCVRLIARKVSDRVIEERHKKARKKAGKKGRKPTARYLYFQSWDLYVTNIEHERISSEQVILLYGIRWHVEIVFKVWKSYHGLEELKGHKKERTECFMYGRLIMIVLMSFLFNTIHRNVWVSRRREASLLMVVKHFHIKSFKMLSLLSKPEDLLEFLVDEFSEACRLCLMDIRKRLSTAQKVRIQG